MGNHGADWAVWGRQGGPNLASLPLCGRKPKYRRPFIFLLLSLPSLHGRGVLWMGYRDLDGLLKRGWWLADATNILRLQANLQSTIKRVTSQSNSPLTDVSTTIFSQRISLVQWSTQLSSQSRAQLTLMSAMPFPFFLLSHIQYTCEGGRERERALELQA